MFCKRRVEALREMVISTFARDWELKALKEDHRKLREEHDALMAHLGLASKNVMRHIEIIGPREGSE